MNWEYKKTVCFADLGLKLHQYILQCVWGGGESQFMKYYYPGVFVKEKKEWVEKLNIDLKTTQNDLWNILTV